MSALVESVIDQTAARLRTSGAFTAVVNFSTMNQRADSAQRFSVYYDGACPLCNKEIDTYRKVTGAEQLSWLDVANCDPSMLGEDLDGQEALARMHVRDENGKLISGAAAFAAIWSRLPRTRWLGKLMGTRPALWILEPSYLLFLRVRPLWRKPAGSRICDSFFIKRG